MLKRQQDDDVSLIMMYRYRFRAKVGIASKLVNPSISKCNVMSWHGVALLVFVSVLVPLIEQGQFAERNVFSSCHSPKFQYKLKSFKPNWADIPVLSDSKVKMKDSHQGPKNVQ